MEAVGSFFLSLSNFLGKMSEKVCDFGTVLGFEVLVRNTGRSDSEANDASLWNIADYRKVKAPTLPKSSIILRILVILFKINEDRLIR